MNQAKLFTLVLSSSDQRYVDVLEKGQVPTWIRRGRELGFTIVPYSEASSSRSAVGRALDLRIRSSQLLDGAVFPNRGPVKRGPGALSAMVENHMRNSSLLMDKQGILRDSVGKGFGFIGARTLRAFEYALDNYDFEFLARTNTSSYVNLSLLSSLLPDFETPGTVHALSSTWRGREFPSGALYVLSRSDLKKIVEAKRLWIHEYIDDVALGLLLKEIIPVVKFVSIPRFDFPFGSRTVGTVPSTAYPHYRCKSPLGKITIDRMLALEDWLSTRY